MNIDEELNNMSLAEFSAIPGLYEILYEEYVNDAIDELGEDAPEDSFFDYIMETAYDDRGLLQIPGVYEVISEYLADYGY